MYTRIKVSWLHKQTFCEYQLYLSECKHISAPSLDLVAGTAAHRDLDEQLSPDSVHITALADRIYQAQAKYQPFTAREVSVQGNRLYGVMDQLVYHLNHVEIIENKPRTMSGIPYLADKRQVLGYCMAFSEQFPDFAMPIIAKVCDRSGALMWEHQYDDADCADLNDCIDRILGIVNGARQAVPSSKPQKCQSCRYLKVCDGTPLRRTR